MKVNGQLEVAQAEQLAADPAVAPTGRFYMNIASAARGLMKVFDGTQWQQIAYQSASALYSQNSGTTVTVDWSRGLNQEVILTGHCTISFTNPQTGQFHRLVVTQKTYASAAPKLVYQYKFNMTDQDPQRNSYQPIGALQPGENQVYTWYYTAAIRAAYATAPAALPTPLSNLGEAGSGIDVSPDGKSLTIGRITSPFVANVQWFDGSQRGSLGALNTITAPTAAAAKAIGVKFSPDQNSLFTIGGTSPYLQGWPVVDSKAIGAAYANPGTLPTGAGQCVDVHPSANYVICGHTTTPFMSAYPYDQAGYGTKVTNPASLPAAQVNGVAFSPLGDYVAAAGATTPFLQVWPFDPSAGSFGTIAANPGTLPPAGPAAGLGKQVAWRPQGDYIAMTVSGSTAQVYVVAFNRATGTFGTSAVDTSLSVNGTSVAWTPDGQYLIVGMSASPFMKIYDFSAGTIGTAVTFDVSAPTIQVNDIVVDKTGRFMMLAVNATPGIQVFPLPTKVRNYLRV